MSVCVGPRVGQSLWSRQTIEMNRRQAVALLAASAASSVTVRPARAESPRLSLMTAGLGSAFLPYGQGIATVLTAAGVAQVDVRESKGSNPLGAGATTASPPSWRSDRTPCCPRSIPASLTPGQQARECRSHLFFLDRAKTGRALQARSRNGLRRSCARTWQVGARICTVGGAPIFCNRSGGLYTRDTLGDV